MDKPYVRTDSCPIARALNQHESRLLRYVITICRNADTASEVVQETFFRLCALESIPKDEHLSCWLFRVARNLAIDQLRKETRMQKADSEVLDSTPLPDPNAPRPEERMEKQDQEDQIRDSVQTLPVTQQEVIRLRFESGLSYKQISEITGQSVSHVGFLLHTAVKRLRQKLGTVEPNIFSVVRFRIKRIMILKFYENKIVLFLKALLDKQTNCVGNQNDRQR